MSGYFLKGTRGEYLLVLRSDDLDLIGSIVNRLGSMREKEIKELVKELQFSLESLDE